MLSIMADRRRPPEIFVLAGPNGAGESTTARVLLPRTLHIDQFVNADLIAEGLSPFAPASAALEAGRIMLQRIHMLRQQRQSFGFETTLASKSYLAFLRGAQLDGYVVHLAFIWLNSVALAAARVATRVRQGGHAVPLDTIARRYDRGLHNLFVHYMPLVNTWTICDNSGHELNVVAHGDKEGALEPVDGERFNLILRSAGRDRVG